MARRLNEAALRPSARRRPARCCTWRQGATTRISRAAGWLRSLPHPPARLRGAVCRGPAAADPWWARGRLGARGRGGGPALGPVQYRTDGRPSDGQCPRHGGGGGRGGGTDGELDGPRLAREVGARLAAPQRMRDDGGRGRASGAAGGAERIAATCSERSQRDRAGGRLADAAIAGTLRRGGDPKSASLWPRRRRRQAAGAGAAPRSLGCASRHRASPAGLTLSGALRREEPRAVAGTEPSQLGGCVPVGTLRSQRPTRRDPGRSHMTCEGGCSSRQSRRALARHRSSAPGRVAGRAQAEVGAARRMAAAEPHARELPTLLRPVTHLEHLPGPECSLGAADPQTLAPADRAADAAERAAPALAAHAHPRAARPLTTIRRSLVSRAGARRSLAPGTGEPASLAGARPASTGPWAWAGPRPGARPSPRPATHAEAAARRRRRPARRRCRGRQRRSSRRRGSACTLPRVCEAGSPATGRSTCPASRAGTTGTRGAARFGATVSGRRG